MSTTISVRLAPEVKEKLEALSKASNRLKSFLAAEAISNCVEPEQWQLGEIQAAIAELDAGGLVEHEEVAKWLQSWGKKRERKAPG